MSTQIPNPGIVMEHNLKFVQSKALQIAVDLDVFSDLSGKSKKSSEVAKSLGVNANAIEQLMDVLVMMDILNKDNGKYGNTATAETFLVKGKSSYLGPLIQVGKRIMNLYENGCQIVKDGGPNNQTDNQDDNENVNDATDSNESKSFAYAMHGIAIGVAKQLSDAIDLSDRKLLLDIGGGVGSHSIYFAAANPQLRATVFEMSRVVPLAKEIINKNNMADRISVVAGNWNDGDFQKGHDVILMSQILHMEKTEKAKELLRKAYEALPNDGLLIVMEFLMNANKTGPWFPVIFNLNMLIEHGTQGFSGEELKEFIKGAGFSDLQEIPLKGPQSVITARKSY